MALARYVKEVRNYLEPYFKRGTILGTTRRCCITIHSNTISLLHVNKWGEQTEILANETLQFENPDNLQYMLSDINQKYLLSTTPIYWLLSPDEYQLFIIEGLPVKEEEILDAIKWRIRSMIAYPIEEAVLDYFNMPGKKGSTSPMLAITAVKKVFLNKMVSVIKGSHLNLTTITIPELALKNLTGQFENDEKCTAVIYFHSTGAILNISCQKTLYFTHHLNWTSASAVDPVNLEQICLDMLRYFDFFQSQWRMPSPSRIHVVADPAVVSEICNSLSQRLSLNVTSFDIKAQAIGKTPFVQIIQPFLLLYGCALREEKNYVTSGY